MMRDIFDSLLLALWRAICAADRRANARKTQAAEDALSPLVRTRWAAFESLWPMSRFQATRARESFLALSDEAQELAVARAPAYIAFRQSRQTLRPGQAPSAEHWLKDGGWKFIYPANSLGRTNPACGGDSPNVPDPATPAPACGAGK